MAILCAQVSNNSKTDPCAWVAMVVQQKSNGDYLVMYPFHDSQPEDIKVRWCAFLILRLCL